jgi:ATP-binding cassette subfamily C (CFTR/MRP) protein 1
VLTLRENLDPLGERSDAELNDLLKLVRNESSKGSLIKFMLDAEVAHEGSNFSAGERQHCKSCPNVVLGSDRIHFDRTSSLNSVVLLRAIARRCKVMIMDEATSSVDPETDALIQRIIQTQLADITVSLHA